MNISRDPLPPVNNALLPDIYNKLDAGTIEKTRVANSVLDLRLGVEQKIIAKYRREAERMFQSQKTSAVADLSRIAQKLPSQLAQPQLGSYKTSKGMNQKGYMTERNGEAICQRCYIHHLPTKKRFYKAEPKTPSPNPFEILVSQLPGKDEVDAGSETSKVTYSSHDNVTWKERSASQLRKINRAAKVIAPIEKYKFLDRDLCGRDKDLNDTLTPRLVPYEEWKKVVKNVCSQCKKELRGLSSRGLLSCRTSSSQERTIENSHGRKSELSQNRRASRNVSVSRESSNLFQKISVRRNSQSHQQQRRDTRS